MLDFLVYYEDVGAMMISARDKASAIRKVQAFFGVGEGTEQSRVGNLLPQDVEWVRPNGVRIVLREVCMLDGRRKRQEG